MSPPGIGPDMLPVAESIHVRKDEDAVHTKTGVMLDREVLQKGTGRAIPLARMGESG